MRDRRLVRLSLLHHLRAAYGIKIKGGRGQLDFGRQESTSVAVGGKIFGVPFSTLPQSFVPGYGNIPSFLVDACTSLEEHVHIEGLFRKSGSVIRLKALKSKLDHGESCLSSAPPCDIAGLLKQFFRELPEPILPVDLHEALIKAQQLETEEKDTATMLLSCLMTDSIIYILRYFFNFLRNVSLRAGENKMDSSNLAVIFAPNLLQSNDGHEKMSANTEKKLRLQAAVVKTLIDHAADIGHVPEFIIEKIPVMLGIDGPCSTPSLHGYEEGEYESPIVLKRKRRQSVGDFVSGALNKLKSNRTPSTTPQQEKTALSSVTPVILTPKIKRKLPIDSSHGFSSKKRKSIKASLNFELLPSSLFSSVSTPAPVQFEESPGASSQSSISPIAISGNHLFNTGVQRRSKRIASKKVCRVESGKSGCFSPKISRKEKVRRSLRLKFSLKKSSRDVNRCSGLNRYEHVGRRLASQQDFKNRIESVKTGLLFSPDVDERLTKKGSKHISKSEENLLTPEQTDDVNCRMSWTGPNSNFQEISTNGTSLLVGTFDKKSSPSEPVLRVEIPPEFPCELTDINVNDKHENSLTGNSLSGYENNLTTETLVKIQKAFSKSGSDLNALISDKPPSESDSREEKLNEVPNAEFSPEKNLFETKEYHEMTVLFKDKHDENHNKEEDSTVSEQNLVNHIQNLVKDTIMESHTIQKTKSDENLHLNMPRDYSNKQEFPRNDQKNKQELPRDKEIITMEETKISIEENELSCSNSEDVVINSSAQITGHILKLPQPRNRTARQQSLVQTCDKILPGDFQMTDHGRVSDHIHWFNKLSLNDSRTESKVKSPLKFQRTPVRQSVRRINSLIEMSRKSERLGSFREVPSPLVKSMSCDSDLSFHIENTSNNSSTALLYSDHKQEQKSMPCDQSNTELTSKSSIELSSKPCSKVKRHADSCSTSLRPISVCKQKVILGSQTKSVLEDLTNQESLKSVVNTSTAFSVNREEKSVFRKPSGRERVWYKGSPKNPIAKVQLLPTTKPLEL
ncbi:rho GTPase-activating protein 11A isoform X2 [Dromiciops gliroides]|uniref:rho GTPase-activating protein 11A isoform X2 n=1 Tax=Dromiciops gliroides TaxID=33562 RepID=UPI001CC7DF5C|nr:rho GTPase-activating protein 11A isoform X2 [Dromiciops gliroides]